MIEQDKLITTSIRDISEGKKILQIMHAALIAVDADVAVRRFVCRKEDKLSFCGRLFDLTEINRIYLIATGKASVPMASAINEIIGDLLTAGIVITKAGNNNDSHVWINNTDKLLVYQASHPIPDETSLLGSSQIIKLLENASNNDLVIILLSGGSSALSTKPVDGVSLADMQALTNLLLSCGASINEINTIRKHLDKVKGGRLTELASPATVVTLVLSDVVGNPIDIIASGPTVADPTTYEQALGILDKYQLTTKVPESILLFLKDGVSGINPETPKPGNPIFHKSEYFIIGSNYLAAQAAVDKAKDFGFNSLLLTTYLQGEACQVGKVIAAITRQILIHDQPLSKPACLVAAGETTVTLNKDPSKQTGLGGRNQELALSCIIELAGCFNFAIISLATDGSDGPTNAAGAVITDKTLLRAKQSNLDPIEFLNHHDTYHFFEQLGDLLKPGSTQTKVNDLVFVFCF